MNTKEKKCAKCKEVKLKICFDKNNDRKSGILSRCKKCRSLDCQKYGRTLPGLVSRIYSSQKYKSKERNHNLPNYTKEELFQWLELHPQIEKIYVNWEKSGYNKNLTPSIDRINNYLPYRMDNIQLMTWIENKNKAYEDRKKGILIGQSKSVIKIDKNGNEKEYHSGKEAERQTGIHDGNISLVCCGKRKTAGGFRWKFKN